MIGLSSGVCTLVYTPLKMVYAAGGVGVGALVWLFSAGSTSLKSRLTDAPVNLLVPSISTDSKRTPGVIEKRSERNVFSKKDDQTV